MNYMQMKKSSYVQRKELKNLFERFHIELHCRFYQFHGVKYKYVFPAQSLSLFLSRDINVPVNNLSSRPGNRKQMSHESQPGRA
jgi:hypothetical protein